MRADHGAGAGNTNRPPAAVYPNTVSARHQAEEAEMRRRLEWLEADTGRYEVEAVILGMQRELHGPTIDELHAETLGRKRVA
jgi:hypothetical protein